MAQNEFSAIDIPDPIHNPDNELAAIINNDDPGYNNNASLFQLHVSSGHPLGVIAIGLTTFMLGMTLSHIDSMWFRTSVGAAEVIPGEHQNIALLALLLQWFSLSTLVIAGVQQALNGDQTGATAYFMNGLGFGAFGYMIGGAWTTMHVMGYAMYALFYFNLIISLSYYVGNGCGKYRVGFTLLYFFLSMFGLFAGLRFADASAEEERMREKGRYDHSGDLVAAIMAFITATIAAILAVPLLTGRSFVPTVGVSMSVKTA